MVNVGGEERRNGGRKGCVGHEGECSVLEHGWSERGDQRNGLSMQVAEHGLRAPAPNEADDVRIDLPAEHGHGTSGPETSSGDIGRPEMQMGQGGGRGAEDGRESLGGYRHPRVVAANRAEGGV